MFRVIALALFIIVLGNAREAIEVRVADSRSLLVFRNDEATLAPLSETKSAWSGGRNEKSHLPTGFEDEAKAVHDKRHAEQEQARTTGYELAVRSPSCRLLAGVRHSSAAVRAIEVEDQLTHQVIWSRQLGENETIEDLAWTSNESSLLALVTTSRVSFSPLGILAISAGHEQKLFTYRLLRVVLASGKEEGRELVKDFDSQYGRFVSSNDICPRNGT
jgi:hypothetical protein